MPAKAHKHRTSVEVEVACLVTPVTHGGWGSGDPLEHDLEVEILGVFLDDGTELTPAELGAIEEWRALPLESGTPECGIRDFRGAAIYIADNSGDWPHETDDGPLLLDRSRFAGVSADRQGCIWCSVPVIREQDLDVPEEDREAWCGCTPRELRWLVERTGLRVKISAPQVEDLSVLWGLRHLRVPEAAK